MITIDLNKEDLILLIQNSQPNKEIKENDTIKELGRYNTYTNVWDWDINFLKELQDTQLTAIYKILRNKELNAEEKMDLPFIKLNKQIKDTFQGLDEMGKYELITNKECLRMKHLIMRMFYCN